MRVVDDGPMSVSQQRFVQDLDAGNKNKNTNIVAPISLEVVDVVIHAKDLSTNTLSYIVESTLIDSWKS